MIEILIISYVELIAMEKTYQSRRQVLQLSGVALAGGLAGCFGDESDEDSSNEATGSDETDTVEEEKDDTRDIARRF